MTTQETTEKKVICKNAGVSPVFSHIIPYETWWGHVAINGEIKFTKTYKSKNSISGQVAKMRIGRVRSPIRAANDAQIGSMGRPPPHVRPGESQDASPFSAAMASAFLNRTNR